ncbi:hypothetical protein VTN77DRAFT_4945 [Rasamsonia byssochlamydoides]|uniref:uncharacterized protein n=1 Tax=Rasamsonia byssochlamydoides TaxID=89139 RepID=UPI003741F179
MAAPAPQAPPVGPDTLVTVKVLYNDTNRRFKIPLRDLGARVFPQKLRQLLAIPADVDVSFERYSDSAACYVHLDSENPAVYKQLYRAAKAKLKLRIKATTITQPAPMPECPPTPVVQAVPVQKEPSQRYSYLETVLSPPLPPPTATNKMLPPAGPTLDPPEAVDSLTASKVETAPADASQVQPRYRLFTLGQDKPTYPLLFPSADSPTTAFCIDCNNCGRSIPGEHYHCSICDDGDYDLCPACVDAGVTCHGEDHWLIKRLVQNGIVTNSTTETIAPRRLKVEPEAQPKTCQPEIPQEKTTEPVSSSQPVSISQPVSTSQPVAAVPNPAEGVGERTCNACFREFDETKMVTCTDCEDYDLCLTCLLKDAHGHHPAHTFSLIHDREFCLKNLVLSRCRPGRHQHHAAICDGCDKRIIGVRHKCLACPDWDFCWSCIKTAPETHPGHRFVPIYEAIADPIPNHEIHYGIFCDGPLCRNMPTYITGVRYKCAVCHDTDFCAACEALPTNPHNRTHPLIKFKTPVRNVSVSTFGDDGFGGPVISMGDRVTPVIPQVAAPSSSNVTIVEKQAEEEPREEKKSDEKHAEEELLEQKKTEEEHVVEEDVQPEAPEIDPTVENEQTKSTMMTASASASEYQAFFMRDTVRDGTKLPPGHVFQQTWTLYNPGPLAWPAGSSVRFVGGDSMFNVDLTRPTSVKSITSAMESNELTAPLEPGESADFTVTLKTPQREGTSISYWRLKLPDGTPFGHKLWCDVQVREDADPPETEMTAVTPEVKEEPKLNESDMIFPKLEKESPISSTHEAEVVAEAAAPSAPSAPSLSTASEQDVLEDVESLTLEDVDTDGEGFLTDEEYDILDASDEEFTDAKQG